MVKASITFLPSGFLMDAATMGPKAMVALDFLDLKLAMGTQNDDFRDFDWLELIEILYFSSYLCTFCLPEGIQLHFRAIRVNFVVCYSLQLS